MRRVRNPLVQDHLAEQLQCQLRKEHLDIMAQHKKYLALEKRRDVQFRAFQRELVDVLREDTKSDQTLLGDALDKKDNEVLLGNNLQSRGTMPV